MSDTLLPSGQPFRLEIVLHPTNKAKVKPKDTPITTMPKPVWFKACGCNNRSAAFSSKNTAEPVIKADCTKADRLSALP